MKTLIIYDIEGTIIAYRSGEPSPKEPVGIPFLWVEIPKNKYLSKIDTSVTPNVPILEDIPKSDIELAKERITALEQSNAELTTLVSMQSTPTE